MSGARAVPDEYEVIVVGTGLTESILAAACAYAGKRVLHLDRHSYYGSRNASFALQRFVEWLRGEEGEGGDGGGGEERARTPISHAARQETNGRTADSAGGGASPDVAAAVAASEAAVAALEAAVASSEAAVASSEAPHTSVPVAHTRDTPEDVTFIGECAAEGTARANGSWEALLAQSNRFNIDLTPQLLLASGEMVDALRSSKIASYLEFKPVQAHLFGGGPSSTLERVPCSKGDIFSSSKLSLVEKRSLMKFLQACAALQPMLEPHIKMPLQLHVDSFSLHTQFLFILCYSE